MIKPVDYTNLYNICDVSKLSFSSTDELEYSEEPICQKSVIAEVDFGVSIQQEGYNIFAMGPSGIGKHSTIMRYLEDKAKNETAPKDWCYVNNFKNHQKPIAIDFPSGKAEEFKEDIAELIELFKTILPTVFESDNYRKEYESFNQKSLKSKELIYKGLEKEAVKYDVSISAASTNRITYVPILESKVLSPKEFSSLDADQKEKITKKMIEFEAIVKEGLNKIRDINNILQKELKDLERDTTKESVESLIDDIRVKYESSQKVQEYLNELEKDVIHNVYDFLDKGQDKSAPPFMKQFYKRSYERYNVNLFISHKKNSSSPVIYEDNPTHQNVVGKVEHLSQMGTLVTDFNMIKPGALHKANGGYLVLDARKLLMMPFAYEELKRVLRSKEIRMESLSQQYSLISTTSLEPEPIPLDVKVILIGERMLYNMMYNYDPDFKELFKVSVDFDDEMERDEESIELYAQMVGSVSKHNKLLPLSVKAVGRVIEQSSKEISHSLKFSTHLGRLADLLKESDHWAKKNKHKIIEKSDIDQAITTQIERKNRLQKKFYGLIDENTIMINLKGSKVGQINALSYISVGGYSFGIPSRVTARTRIGKGEIIDIERQVELGGPIHSKGVMILGAYLGSKYASDIPLSLSASLVFEQSYGMVEGDSASSTELYALLSSLSNLPIKQNIAVTGSVNQFGEIQPIGGVNEKIEGFFDICMRQNPDQFYGVIIPQSNVKHLMLKEKVLEAVKNKKFAVYGVKTIDEGISILTGIKAGDENKRGKFPKKSVNALVVKRILELSKTVKEFHKPSNSKS
ncbi:MAG: ATP-binding protein [Campylobacterota bacterium]|nr:ATP-binding protein [Campylobacterota bacterium]